MASREKVLVSLMVVAVVWGLFTLVRGGCGRGKAGAGEGAGSGGTLSTNDIAALQASLPGPHVAAYLGSARAPFAGNPFEVSDAPQHAAVSGAPAAAAEFVFSGRIRTGAREIVIINGREYFEGETLATGGWVLHKVFPDKVLLRSIDGGRTNEAVLVETTKE